MSDAVYLLSGESFLADEALERVRTESGADPLAEADYGSDVEIAELLGALQTPSLLGGRRLVVVRDAQDLKKDHIEALTRYIEEPAASSVLVLIANGRSKLDAVVKKSGTVVTLEAPKGRRLATWVRERAREQKFTLDDRGAWALIDSVGTELRDLEGALEQLRSALGDSARATAADVNRLFPRQADERIFAFTDAVGERRLQPAMTALRRLLDQGEEPLVLFGSLTGHVRRLLRIRRHVDHGTRAVASLLGMPDWRAERMQKQARSYREEELAAALQILAITDIDMKGEFPSPEVALERAVVQIVTGVSAGQGALL
ncbi:MAG TPA: DNA polymerase III subunit delta [Actinomycetota bacterium]|nr:DNA polymerase III subunit delta [Actinomycetota bacterium]